MNSLAGFGVFPVSRRARGGGWKKLGGFWPTRLDGVSADYQLYYAVLRSAIEVLVRYHDASVKGRAAEVRRLRPEVDEVKFWIFDDSCDSPVKLRDIARMASFRVANFRNFITSCGILNT